jgi:hypothetical protein
VVTQQRQAADGEAVAGMALHDPPDPRGVELPGANADHVEEDAVVGEVLDGALLGRHRRVEVEGDRVEHVVLQQA